MKWRVRVLSTLVAPACLIATNALAADLCQARVDALARHSVKPLISNAAKTTMSSCAGSVAASAVRNRLNEILDRKKRNQPTNTDCIERTVVSTIEQSASAFVDNQFKQYQNRQAVQAMLDENAEAQTAAYGSIAADIQALRACREGEVVNTQTQYKAGRITKQQRDADLDAARSRVESDNGLIAGLIGSGKENLQVLETNSKALQEMQANATADVGYTPGGSGAIARAAEGQTKIEQEQQSYEALLKQIEQEREFVLSQEVG